MIREEVANPGNKPFWLFILGITAGVVIAIAAFLPITFRVLHALDVAGPTYRPHSPGFNAANASSAYWVTWVCAVAVLAIPGLLLVLARRSRSVGRGYLVAAVPVGIMLAAIVICFEISGFTAS